MEFGSIINGQQVFSGKWLDVYNPYHQKKVGRVSTIDARTTEKILRDSHAIKINLTRYERYQILNRMADAIDRNAVVISKMITDESGLSIKDTTYEASRVSDVIRFSAIKTMEDDSQVFPCDISKNGKKRRIYTTRYPLKLIAAITPFNHPMNQVVHKIAPAIATNNKVVLKPSEKTPLSAYYFAQLALECGVPAGMINVINGDSTEVAEQMVKSDLVSLVTFTGSSEIGKRIAKNAGYKKLILELGGSSALIVLPDADLYEAADITVAGVFKNSGQRCSSIRRLLVHRDIADDFAKILVEKTQAIKYGDPYDPNTDMGTIISEEAAKQIEIRISATITQGAKCLIGHKRIGATYSPTVLDNVENHYAVIAQETFGPVAPIIRFDTLDQAIAIANDSPYGLSGAVVSNHWPSIQRVITELDTGTINVNEAPGYRLEWTPFGGVKDSGLGYKEGVIETMKAYTNVKTYSLPWDTP
ncbi:MAG: phosphonoacetaldehyde dehydrogenase [Bacteroidota bacterium]